MIFLHRHPGNFRLPHDRWSHRQSFRFGTGCPDDENWLCWCAVADLELSHQACLTFICRTMMLELFICRCFCRLRTDLELRTFAKKKPLKIWSSLGKASANLRIGHCQIASRAWHRRGMVLHISLLPSGAKKRMRFRYGTPQGHTYKRHRPDQLITKGREAQNWAPPFLLKRQLFHWLNLHVCSSNLHSCWVKAQFSRG